MTIAKAAMERQKEAKAELVEELEDGDNLVGKIGNVTIGKAYWTAGRQSLVLTNEAELLAWVEENHPTEIVRAVRPSFLTALTEMSKGKGGPVINRDGDVVPGVEIVQGDRYMTVRAGDDAVNVVTGLIRNGFVELNGIRQKELEAVQNRENVVEYPLPDEQVK
jgi:hypothetical protein